MKKFTINFDEVRNRGIPPDVFMYILCLYFNLHVTQETKDIANNLGLTIKDTDSDLISPEGIIAVQDVFVSSDFFHEKPDKDYIETSKQLSHIFPKGIKPSTSSYWRGSVEIGAYKLKLLELKIGRKLPHNAILQAAKEYVKTFEDDKEYMQTLPNFIFKHFQNPDGITEWQSNLLTIIENLQEDEHTN